MSIFYKSKTRSVKYPSFLIFALFILAFILFLPILLFVLLYVSGPYSKLFFFLNKNLYRVKFDLVDFVVENKLFPMEYRVDTFLLSGSEERKRSVHKVVTDYIKALYQNSGSYGIGKLNSGFRNNFKDVEERNVESLNSFETYLDSFLADEFAYLKGKILKLELVDEKPESNVFIRYNIDVLVDGDKVFKVPLNFSFSSPNVYWFGDPRFDKKVGEKIDCKKVNLLDPFALCLFTGSPGYIVKGDVVYFFWLIRSSDVNMCSSKDLEFASCLLEKGRLPFVVMVLGRKNRW